MIFRKHNRAIRWANDLLDLAWRYRQARVVHVTSTTGIFDRLGRAPATARAIARDLRLVAEMVEKLLIVLAAMGLARRIGDAWALTPRARTILLPASPYYQGNMLNHSGQVWGFWNDLEAVVRGRRGASKFVTGAASCGPPIRSWRDFILGMHNMAMAGRAAELADRVDLRGRRHLIDVGGGPGSYSMALCERYPLLRATVFDLPRTIRIARQVIRRLGMTDRVTAAPGDWDRDEFGSGADVVLMSNIMHGPGSRAEMKLAKAYRALAPGGILIVQDFLLNAAKTGPLIPAMFNVMVGAFSLPEMAGRMRDAGFRSIRATPMPPHVGTTILTAKKP